MTRRIAVPLLALALAGCEMLSKDKAKQDTTTTLPDSTALSRARAGADSAVDSVARAGVPATPSDSAMMSVTAGQGAAADSGVAELTPAAPQVGGVLVVRAQMVGVGGGTGYQPAQCTWRGAAVPCYGGPSGVVANVPLTPEVGAGTSVLTVDGPAGRRLTRQVQVAPREFGRQLVFLDSAHYALVRRSADVARDARALRQVLRAESPEPRWTGAWRDPVRATAPWAGYGVERFYYRASDSSRVVSVPATLKARGTFGGDTSSAAPKAGDVPGWRHAGVDIAARRGTSVTAPAAGVVLDVGDYVLSGHTLVLDHGQGVTTAYFHLDTILVHRGDLVKVGATLARVGATGLATGPHLHYGVYIHGEPVDPAAWKDVTATTVKK